MEWLRAVWRDEPVDCIVLQQDAGQYLMDLVW